MYMCIYMCTYIWLHMFRQSASTGEGDPPAPAARGLPR